MLIWSGWRSTRIQWQPWNTVLINSWRFFLFCFVLFCFVLFFLLTSLMNWNQSYVTELDTGWCKILVLTDQSGKRSIWIVPHPLKQRNIGKKNRMKKTRDLLKKIRDTKQTFHAKMGSIKDRSGLGLKEAENFKKRWQKYTEKMVQKRYSWPR